MRIHFKGAGFGRKLFLNAILAALMGAAAVALASAQAPSQSPAPAWQAAAGGKMAFDTASVKRNTTASSHVTGSNFPLGPGDVYAPNGGMFRATNSPLIDYLVFAYKLTDNDEQSLVSQLPKWTMTDRFDIQGHAGGNPTKDQMRLMMQSLLADRFRLAVHYETRQVPVFALILDQPGKLGPLLRKHADDSPCPTNPVVPSPAPAAPAQFREFPAACGGVMSMAPSVPGRFRAGARNISMALLASSMTGGNGVDRPILDKTGLTGMFDCAIEYTPQIDGSWPPDAVAHRDLTGPTFIQALQEQLGLRLEPETVPMEFLVVDYVEEVPAN